MPEVSIIVATYNPDNQKLKATLAAACAQEDVSFEIIITDDASKEKDFVWLSEFFREKGITDYKILEHAENGGTVKNCFDAVCAAKGKYVFITSPGDILFDKTVLKDFYDFAEKNEAGVSFGNAVFYSNENGNVKLTRQYGSPLRPQLYAPDKQLKTKNTAFFGCDWIIGAAYFRKTVTAKKYFEQVLDVCRYTEDSSSTAFALADGVNIQYFDRNIVWYEDGTGISTARKSKWDEILKNESIQAVKKLKRMFPNNPYVDILFCNLVISDRRRRLLKKLLTHPVLCIKIAGQKKLVKNKQVACAHSDLDRLKNLLSF
ncbi:MAG: glycosyltransferase family 2 protein [Oscillospiraceae bacterium]|nr:glycosyltransferase family 2 protein [Oscillospiraceae bacterium]